ncbi:MAG TPA: hypothetical protein VGW33_07220 [Terriglobia bacterium]|nr:hypothetical protein [Terriglobia bacterium]
MAERVTAGLLASLTLAGMATLASCGGRPRAVVYVGTPPPPAVVERVGVAPGPGFVWIAGYQSWNGSAYVWVPGRWERRPPRRHGWVPGHWVHTGRGWYWVRGHWR